VIGKTLGVASAPTLDRIVKTRPFLRPVDAISVPGVGPAKRDVLNSKFCATPTTLPPVSESAPRSGSDALDLQVATGDQIAALGILSKEVAQRLADYGPLPDNLHSIATPAVPGLSDPLIDRLMDSGKVSITPQPFTFQGKTWKWVTHDHGAVVEAPGDSRYALIVPPNRVTGDGAWATATPLPDEYGSLPSGDFHIYGDWTPYLATRLPSAYPGETTDSALVWHDASDGLRMSTAPYVVSDGATVTSTVSSLSTITSSTKPFGTSCDRTPGTVWCAADAGTNTWLQNTQDGSFNAFLARLNAYQVKYQPAAPGPCPTGSGADRESNVTTPRVVTRGTLYPGECSLNQQGGKVTATVTNTSPVGDFFAFGSTMTATISSGTLTATMADPNERGLVSAALFGTIHANHPTQLTPMYGVSFAFTEGGDNVTLTTKSDTWEQSFGAWSTYQFTSIADGLVFAGLMGMAGYSTCMPSALSIDMRYTANCFAKVAEAAALSPEVEWSSKDRALVGAIAKAARAVAIGIDFIFSTAQWAMERSPVQATFQFLPPPPPPVSPGGSGSLSLSGDGRFIAMNRDSHRAFLVVPPASPGGTPEAQWIQTSDGFNCYAEGYLVVDFVKTYVGTDGRERLQLSGDPIATPGNPAPACSRGGPHWDYKSPVVGGNTPQGVILKMPDWLGTQTWWTAADGTVQPINDGGTYICLAAKAPVLWNFHQDMVPLWKNPAGVADGPSSTHASCS